MRGVQVLDSLIDGPLELANEREGNELIGMVVRYLRTGAEPDPRTDAQRMALAMVRPVLEKSRARIEAGARGGNASKQESKRGSKAASKRESKTDDAIPYAEIVAMLNDATGKAYRPTSEATRRLIRARWAEGYREPEFRRVVETMAEAWGNDPKMAAYLRPETLFGAKFEGYLNRKPGKGAQVDPFENY